MGLTLWSEGPRNLGHLGPDLDDESGQVADTVHDLLQTLFMVANHHPLIGESLLEVTKICWVHVWPVYSVKFQFRSDPNAVSRHRNKVQSENLITVMGNRSEGEINRKIVAQRRK